MTIKKIPMKTYHQAHSAIEKKNSTLSSLLFILSPLLAVYSAFKNYHSKWAKNIIWLFVAFYGYTMVISSEKMDAAGYRDELFRMQASGMDFSQFWSTLYNPMYGELDLVNPVLTYIVSLLTSNYHILFAVYGLIFGFFYSRNIWYLFEHAKGDVKKYAIAYLITFTLIIGFWNINGFRFWCAAHVFFYGAIPYIVERRTNRLWVSLAAVLFHFSFFIPIILLMIYIFIANKVQVYFYFFIFTFFVKSINLEVLGNFLQRVLPEMLQGKARGYTNPEYAESLAEGIEKMNFYARLYSEMLGWVVVVFFIYIYLRGVKKIKDYSPLFNLFNFSLFFLGVSNLLALVPSGNRFEVIGNLFAFTAIFFYLQYVKLDKWTRSLTYIVLPLLVVFIIISLRMSMDTIGLTTIVGNPVAMFFVNNDWALIDLLK